MPFSILFFLWQSCNIWVIRDVCDQDLRWQEWHSRTHLSPMIREGMLEGVLFLSEFNYIVSTANFFSHHYYFNLFICDKNSWSYGDAYQRTFYRLGFQMFPERNIWNRMMPLRVLDQNPGGGTSQVARTLYIV